MKRVRSLYICALVFSLLLVAVGNFLSFHSDVSHSDGSQISYDQYQVNSADNHASEHPDADPCDSGYCHLGHCAKLVFAEAFVPNVQIENQSKYFPKIQAMTDLVLDGPYQPPKLS